MVFHSPNSQKIQKQGLKKANFTPLKIKIMLYLQPKRNPEVR